MCRTCFCSRRTSLRILCFCFALLSSYVNWKTTTRIYSFPISWKLLKNMRNSLTEMWKILFDYFSVKLYFSKFEISFWDGNILEGMSERTKNIINNLWERLFFDKIFMLLPSTAYQSNMNLFLFWVFFGISRQASPCMFKSISWVCDKFYFWNC